MFSLKKIALDRENAEPLHLQLFRELARLLREEDPAAGLVLPSERVCAEQLQMNRLTVHRAYAELLGAGVVCRRPDRRLELSPGARKKLEGRFPAVGILLPFRLSCFQQAHCIGTLRYLTAIIDRAAERGYSVFMLQLPPADSAPAEIKAFMDSHLPGLTGLIHLGDRRVTPDPVLAAICRYTGIPQVSITGFWDEYPHIGSVCCDFREAALAAAEAMRDRGVRRIGMLQLREPGGRGCSRHDFHYASADRKSQLRTMWEETGFEFPPEWQLADQLDREAFGKLCAAAPLPDVFWCFNDDSARKFLDWCRALHIRVPEDLGVIGFDGDDDSSELTTIRQPLEQIGAGAVDMLLERFEYGADGKERFRKFRADFVMGRTL